MQETALSASFSSAIREGPKRGPADSDLICSQFTQDTQLNPKAESPDSDSGPTTFIH